MKNEDQKLETVLLQKLSCALGQSQRGMSWPIPRRLHLCHLLKVWNRGWVQSTGMGVGRCASSWWSRGKVWGESSSTHHPYGTLCNPKEAACPLEQLTWTWPPWGSCSCPLQLSYANTAQHGASRQQHRSILSAAVYKDSFICHWTSTLDLPLPNSEDFWVHRNPSIWQQFP